MPCVSVRGVRRLALCQGGVTEEDVVPETQLRAQNRKHQLQTWPQG